eukprot:GHVS01101000.1.p1 GENE.GHVS01101000.1~~GHVS01101000.1.p1  ORF type:complete len:205 (-),score=10.98 GHVS01101000.1:416-1030(-)
MEVSSCAQYFSSYAAYHRNPINKIIHVIFVPSIFLSLLLMFSLFTPSTSSILCEPQTTTTNNVCLIIRLWIPTAIDNLFVLWLAYLMVLSLRCSIPIGLITCGLYVALIKLAGIYLSLPLPSSMLKTGAIGLFTLGWIMQIIGHFVFEGRKPALLDNLWQFNVAPMFITVEVLFYFGFFPALHKECERLINRHLANYRASKNKQ